MIKSLLTLLSMFTSISFESKQGKSLRRVLSSTINHSQNNEYIHHLSVINITVCSVSSTEDYCPLSKVASGHYFWLLYHYAILLNLISFLLESSCSVLIRSEKNTSGLSLWLTCLPPDKWITAHKNMSHYVPHSPAAQLYLLKASGRVVGYDSELFSSLGSFCSTVKVWSSTTTDIMAGRKRVTTSRSCRHIASTSGSQ